MREEVMQVIPEIIYIRYAQPIRIGTTNLCQKLSFEGEIVERVSFY